MLHFEVWAYQPSGYYCQSYGKLCAGLLMRNIPWSAVDAFNPRWGVQMRAAALATIFLRCVAGRGADKRQWSECWLVCRAHASWPQSQ